MAQSTTFEATYYLPYLHHRMMGVAEAEGKGKAGATVNKPRNYGGKSRYGKSRYGDSTK